MPKEIGEAGFRMLVGLPQAFLCHEEVGSLQGGTDGGDVIGCEVLTTLEPLQGWIFACEVFDQRLDLSAVGVSKRTFAGWTEDDPMPLLNVIGERKADEGACGATIPKPHERSEGLLQLHDTRTGEIGPKGAGLSGGQGFEMRANFRNASSLSDLEIKGVHNAIIAKISFKKIKY